MSVCSWSKEVEKWFDGEAGSESGGAAAHAADCPECAARVAALNRIREATVAVKRKEIGDGQFDAFMRGIRDGLEAPPRRRFSRFWAVASLSTAALIAAVSTIIIVADERPKAEATVVESCSTDLDGATVNAYEDEDGATTIEVVMSKSDIW